MCKISAIHKYIWQLPADVLSLCVEKWIPAFADQAHPLINVKSFPIREEAISAFNLLKKELHSCCVYVLHVRYNGY